MGQPSLLTHLNNSQIKGCRTDTVSQTACRISIYFLHSMCYHNYEYLHLGDIFLPHFV